MLFCRVTGTAVCTVKDPNLTGFKILIVQPVLPSNKTTGSPFAALDTVGAGEGEIVCVTQGSAARKAATCSEAVPIDATIVAIVDSLEVDGKRVYAHSGSA